MLLPGQPAQVLRMKAFLGALPGEGNAGAVSLPHSPFQQWRQECFFVLKTLNTGFPSLQKQHTLIA